MLKTYQVKPETDKIFKSQKKKKKEGGAQPLPEATCLLTESPSLAGYLGQVSIKFAFYLKDVIII